MSVQDKLKKLKKAWKSAEARAGFTPVPDGTYQVRIKDATLEESKASKRLQVCWELEIISDEHEGRKLFKRDGVDDESQLEWFKGNLETLELEAPAEIAGITDVLGEAVGLAVEITVKTANEFQNIYFNDLIEGVDEEEGDEEEDDDDEEEEEEGEDEAFYDSEGDEVDDDDLDEDKEYYDSEGEPYHFEDDAWVEGAKPKKSKAKSKSKSKKKKG